MSSPRVVPDSASFVAPARSARESQVRQYNRSGFLSIQSLTTPEDIAVIREVADRVLVGKARFASSE